MAQSFTELVDIIYFTPENAKLYETENGFAALNAFIPPVNKDDLAIEAKDAEQGNKQPVWQDLGRVLFHRAFPFEKPCEFISVQDEDGKEYGIIRNLADFDGKGRDIVEKALNRKYFCPEIKRIRKLQEQFGYSLWEVDTSVGAMELVLKDTFGSIIRISDTYLIINDISGNRYVISDVSALDRKSYRKIELYL